MSVTVHTIEIMTTAHVLIEFPAGEDEASAYELYALCETAAQPGAVECLSLSSTTFYPQSGDDVSALSTWDCEHTYRELAVSTEVGT
ncbi:hypothetical protein [Streptomyces iconiensis]|uniref:Antibiotic biosynthesis monooxygenase n=1 Tax=Streptomyces iconiensis TaxID=1384038 RepID=A0ABT7AB14_9ACTN|nr:hypothetical protein [Streptomyces iconiensis]MDJ1138501.1 hypothetical protein [Streptomyces iconiensis]